MGLVLAVYASPMALGVMFAALAVMALYPDMFGLLASDGGFGLHGTIHNLIGNGTTGFDNGPAGFLTNALDVTFYVAENPFEKTNFLVMIALGFSGARFASPQEQPHGKKGDSDEFSSGLQHTYSSVWLLPNFFRVMK